MSEPENKDYAVGYGKPPEKTRFQKGQSGNPNGRPKGSLGVLARLQELALKKVYITEKGQKRAVTKLDVALTQLVNQAASGDRKATKDLIGNCLVLESKAPDTNTDIALVTKVDQEIFAELAQKIQSKKNKHEKL